MMTNADAELLRSRVTEVAWGPIRNAIDAGESDRRVPEAAWRALADSGCLGITLPQDYGGEGRGIGAYAIIQEELARVWASAAVATTWNNLSGLLLRTFGSDDQKAQFLPGLASGALSGAVAFTEPHGGSDAAGIRTTATLVGDSWVLDGAKRLIDNVTRSDFVIVSARTGHDDQSRSRGISMFILHRSDPGFVLGEVFDTMGLRPIGVGRFELQRCMIPAERVLGTEGNGFAQMMAMVEFGRTNLAAMCVGIARGAFDELKPYLQERVLFGRPLSESDWIRSRIADLRVRINAARLLTYHAASLIEAGERRCDVESAIAKLHASETAAFVTTEAMQLHGGIGYTSECAIERHFRDCRGLLFGEGTSEIMRLIIGRAELAALPHRAEIGQVEESDA